MKKQTDKIKTIFIGTPDFALPSLRLLASDPRFQIILVITQPDKPQGRKQILTPPPVKSLAQQLKLDISQPEKISSITESIKNLEPDVIVLIAYAQKLPKEILEIPKYGCINLHASLLPKYRGPSPIQAALANGDSQTGLTIMKMDSDIDTGPILAKKIVEILPTDTTATLYDNLAQGGADFLIDTLIKYFKNKITLRQQENDSASYTKVLSKQDGLLDWQKSAQQLECFSRAMIPWPSAWTWWQGKQIKILQIQHEPIEINSYKPGKTFIYNSGLAVQCGQDALIIKRVQLEGSKIMDSQEFLRGHKDFVGAALG